MNRNSLKVFVVDDEISVVEWLSHSVEWEVYNFEILGGATSVPEAMQYMEDNPVDLLITDICMPNLSGIDLIKWVKEKHENCSVIVISAFNQFDYVKEAYRYGIVDYCLKPIDVNELYECLKNVRIQQREEKKLGENLNALLFQQSVLQRLLNSEDNTLHLYEQCQLADVALDVSSFQVVLINLRCQEREKYINAMELLSAKLGPECYAFLDTYMNLVCLFMGERLCDLEAEKQIKYILQQK